jgi:tetratricopeptide (TPR) repeat protein
VRAAGEEAWPLTSSHAPFLRLAEIPEPEDGELEETADGLQQILALDDLKGEKLPAWAAFELGLVRARQRDKVAANAAWRQAMATDDPEYAPRAACFLAVGYQQDEDWVRAREAWQFALDSGNTRYLAAALLGLGMVAQQQDEVEEAIGHWERAVGSRDPEFSGRAAVMLACRHLERGEYDKAEAAFCHVLEIGNDEFRPLALLGLGVGNYEQGDFAEAIEYLGAAAESADPRLLPLVEDYRAEAVRRSKVG